MAKNFGLDDERIGFDQVTWTEWARLVNRIKDDVAMQIRDAQLQLERIPDIQGGDSSSIELEGKTIDPHYGNGDAYPRPS